MLKTVQVKFPPSNNPVTSEQDAISIRNHRVDAMLKQALTSCRITEADIDEYNALYHRLVESENATERAEILTRLSSIDGSASASANASTNASTSGSTDASTHGDAGDGSSPAETVITTDVEMEEMENLDITAPPKYFNP